MTQSQTRDGNSLGREALHPFEEHLLALELNLKNELAQRQSSQAYVSVMANEIAQLRQGVSALRESHGGCVSAQPGEVCEHCLSVVKVRLHMLLERDRRNLRLLSR